MMFISPLYLIMVVVPGMLISGIASWLVHSAFTRYARVATSSGLSGGEAARRILDKAGLYDVQIVHSQGQLSDHYNPANRTLALSEDVLHGRSLAAVGVAAHEAGHALQHAAHYAPLHVRSALVPAVNLLSPIGFYIMAFGIVFSKVMVGIGAILFGLMLIFQLVTLPVEFDASSRAKKLLVQHGVVAETEMRGVRAVLNAAALTYVAAVVTTTLTVLYFLLRSGLLGGRNH